MSIFIVIPFEERLKQNAFGTVRDILHSGQDFNSVVLQVLSVHSHLELVTGESVQFVNQHIIPSLFVAVFHHLLKGIAVVVRACCSSIYVLIYDQNVVTLGIVIAYADLSFDGLFRLSITTVPRVDHYDVFLWAV